ncbi:MAG: VCBS repeat-containing protein [Pseudomonadota bacterium]
MNRKLIYLIVLLGAATSAIHAGEHKRSTPVAESPTKARSAQGAYISWQEHRIDDSHLGDLDLSGSDGLVMGDLDKDGIEDIVSVHESDTEYDGKPIGHIRVAYGTDDPHVWHLGTLADGHKAAAAEDVSVADADGDGYLDVVVAAELAHLIYLKNPGGDQENIRQSKWDYVIPPITTERGSYIRAFFADFDGDGHPEVVAPNKGGQNPAISTQERANISIYHLPENPLRGDAWREQLLTKVIIPINSEPVDLDNDGDLDVVAGSRGEQRILWFENKGKFAFTEHPIHAAGAPADARLTGFNMDYADLDADGRTDIVSTAWTSYLLFLKAPETPEQPWRTTILGRIEPDNLVSVRLSDIDGDGDLDAFAGGYSLGPRDHDGPQITHQDPVGRICWFENPGAQNIHKPWTRHDIARPMRGMYDKWIPRDMDQDGDVDFVGTRGNAAPFDGVIWLEQVRTEGPQPNFTPARRMDSRQLPLP